MLNLKRIISKIYLVMQICLRKQKSFLKISKTLKIILIFLISAILFVLGFFCFLNYQFSTSFNPKDFSQKIFQVKNGEGVKQIAANLEKENLIKNAFYFETYIYLKNKEKELKAGEYLFSPSMNISQITNLFIKGTKKKEIKITIPEGWNSFQIAEYLEKKLEISKEDFFSATYDLKWKNNFLFLKDNKFLTDNQDHPETKLLGYSYQVSPLEGYFFPDTYFVFENEFSSKIIEKMLNNFDKKISLKLKKEIKKQNKTIFEIITMASIIEKETKTDEERKIVSGIFWKRLKNNFPLQSCATVNFILNSDKRILLEQDLKIESLYNTYLNNGLPSGPISNPGLSSILAAIYPQESDYWYFLSTKEGKTIFSKTLEEHNLNKKKYLNP